MSNCTVPACLIVQPIHAAGSERLRAAGILPVTDEDEISPDRIVAAITRNAGFSAARMEALPKLHAIAVHGVGYDPVDINAATRLGIAVTNTPGTNERSVAEQAIALLFALAKQVIAADGAARNGKFDFKYTADLVELCGLTLGIVGFGAIGRQTAAIGRALGMQVLAYSRHQPASTFEKLGVTRANSLEDLLRTSDVVSLHLPATPETYHVIGREELALLKPTAFLINTGRGNTIDQEALVAALQKGSIRGAGLDVFSKEPLPADHPLCTLSNVVLSPHLAGSTEASLRKTAEAAVDCVLSVLAGKRPETLINPEVWSARRMPSSHL